MSKPNGDIRRFQSGVLLGGRQYTLTLPREHDMNLQVFARMNNTTPAAYAEHLLKWSIERATSEFAVSIGIGNLRIYGLR